MPFIQDIIHRIEEGPGMRYLRRVMLPAGILALILLYDFRGTKNFTTQEAMDNAQLARNLAEHKGYTTLFIRPFSVFLLQKTYADVHGQPAIGDMTDRGQVKTPHPDLANPPVYPLLLAGMMKLSPAFRYAQAGMVTLNLGKKKIGLWNYQGNFWMYPPDFYINFVNQLLFVGLTVIIFLMARKMFDPLVAWTSAFLFFTTDLFWRFSVSGLPTMLLMLIFLAVVWAIMQLEQGLRENTMTFGRMGAWAAGVGAIVGVGCLTRYAFGWLILPVLAFLLLYFGQRRLALCFAALGAFAIIVGPWVARNYHLSHTPFGTAGYAVYETIGPYFPENNLQRSLSPDLSRIGFNSLWNKFLNNTRNILHDELPRLGGSWIGAFFLVGLLLPFKNAALSRLRYFVLLCLPVLIAAQALGRTQLSEDSPVINSENLLIILAPAVIIFGTSLFYILLDQLALPIPQLRFLIISFFCALVSLPTLLTFFTILNPIFPRTTALAYPPYYPPLIQKISSWMHEDELIASDVPWAVAWYGQRQSLWLTLTTHPDFFTFFDYNKPIHAVYLTPATLDNRFLGEWVRDGEYGWGNFALGVYLKMELPPYFPLKQAPDGFPKDEIFLTDYERWLENGGAEPEPIAPPPGSVTPALSAPGKPGTPAPPAPNK